MVATPAASLTAPDVDQEILAIAARIERRLERDDPKAEVAKVANFDRMPPIAPVPAAAAPPRPPARPAWHNDPPRPNRADFERAQWWEERAAIIAEGEKCSRELADDLAYKDMLAAFRRGEIW